MDLFVAVKPNKKPELNPAVRDTDPDKVRVKLAQITEANKIVQVWAEGLGGTAVGTMDGAMVVQIPGNQISQVNQLREKYQKHSGRMCAGIGLTTEMALKALQASPGKTTFYTSDIERMAKAEELQRPTGKNFHEDLHRHADKSKTDALDAEKLKATKQAVVQALQGIAQQKPLLDALKQQAPQLHQHLTSLAQKVVDLAGFLPRVKKSENTVKLIHFGKPGISVVDPKYMGTSGVPSQEYKQGLPEIPRSYWYRDGSQPEHLVDNGKRQRYSTQLFNPKLYDLAEDEQKLGPKARERHLEGKGKWTFSDTYLDEVRNAGYHGYYNSRSALPHVVALFHPQGVQPAPKEIPQVEVVQPQSQAQSMAKSEHVGKSPTQRIVDAVAEQFPTHSCQNGDCYYAAEALHHLLGGKQAGWDTYSEGPHWYLRNQSGRTIDPTSIEPKNGRPKKLLTENPSQQALKIIDKVLTSNPVKKALQLPGATRWKRWFTPPGTIKNRKIKVKHADGSTSWKQVGAGMIQGQEAGAPNTGAVSHPVSAREPNSK